MGNLRDFAKRLRDERARLHISRDVLARKTGVTVRTLARIERDKGHRPTDDTIRKLAAAIPALAQYLPPAA